MGSTQYSAHTVLPLLWENVVNTSLLKSKVLGDDLSLSEGKGLGELV